MLTAEQQLREKLRKITALFEGATTAGEREAAAAAIERIREALRATVRSQLPPETQFSMRDLWERRLFSALCRRYGLEPYRYKGQRYTTVVVRAPKSFVDKTLWPEFLELQSALETYLSEATERIIREEVHRDADDATERYNMSAGAGLSHPGRGYFSSVLRPHPRPIQAFSNQRTFRGAAD